MTVPQHNVQIVGPMGMDGMDGIQDMLSGMVPKKKKKRKMTVAEARKYLIKEEAEKITDMDSVTTEDMER